MRYLMIVGAVALAACLGMAEAAVEVIKVGGDIQIRGIARDNWFSIDYDQLGRPVSTPVPDENWLDSTIRLQVEAELTDDVGGVIRLVNERDWRGAARFPVDDDIELDLAYITLDNMFGFPVKATLGRQEILFGEGFLIGDGYNLEAEQDLAYGKSIRRAFDALRVTYSVEPYTVDLFTAKIDDDPLDVTLDGDADLSGFNIHYNHLDIATFDLGYFMGKHRDIDGTPRDVDTRTISLRGEGNILIAGAEGLTVKGEHVWQGGDDAGIPGIADVDIDARAWYLGAEYAFLDVLYQPYFGVTYIFMSGDERGTADFEQFDPLFEDKEFGVIGELTGLTRTNLKAWRLGGGLRPTEALSLGIAYYLFDRDEVGVGVVSDDLGDELNLNLTYDYTEDVQFGLQAAWFDPGAHLAPRTATASQVVGSVKVSF